MRKTSQRGAQRVAPPTQTPDGSDRFDYADAFEIRLTAPDERPAVEWMRCGLERAPLPLRWTILVAHRFLLGFRLAPRSAPGNVLGWRIVTSEPDLVHLQASSPLMRGDLMGQRDSPDQMVLSTYLSFRRPVPARLVWFAVGPLHRRIAPYLLERAAAAGAPGRAGST
jgi:hypothetical protein